jgi:DNA-directed RNA polymerase specialized sigma24 family protein
MYALSPPVTKLLRRFQPLTDPRAKIEISCCPPARRYYFDASGNAPPSGVGAMGSDDTGLRKLIDCAKKRQSVAFAVLWQSLRAELSAAVAPHLPRDADSTDALELVKLRAFSSIRAFSGDTTVEFVAWAREKIPDAVAQLEILKLVRDGEEDEAAAAFEKCWQLYESAFEAAARRVVPWMVDDVLQDARLAAFAARRTLSKLSSFFPWATTIVTNKARDALRAEKRHREKLASAPAPEPAPPPLALALRVGELKRFLFELEHEVGKRRFTTGALDRALAQLSDRDSFLLNLLYGGRDTTGVTLKDVSDKALADQPSGKTRPLSASGGGTSFGEQRRLLAWRPVAEGTLSRWRRDQDDALREALSREHEELAAILLRLDDALGQIGLAFTRDWTRRREHLRRRIEAAAGNTSVISPTTLLAFRLYYLCAVPLIRIALILKLGNATDRRYYLAVCEILARIRRGATPSYEILESCPEGRALWATACVEAQAKDARQQERRAEESAAVLSLKATATATAPPGPPARPHEIAVKKLQQKLKLRIENDVAELIEGTGNTLRELIDAREPDLAVRNAQ